jgi:hypothetical protein
MAKAMLGMLDADHRRATGQRGLQRLHDQFRLADMVDATLRIYDNCRRAST